MDDRPKTPKTRPLPPKFHRRGGFNPEYWAIGSISLCNDRRGFGATTGGLPLPGGSMGQSEMLPGDRPKTPKTHAFPPKPEPWDPLIGQPAPQEIVHRHQLLLDNFPGHRQSFLAGEEILGIAGVVAGGGLFLDRAEIRGTG